MTFLLLSLAQCDTVHGAELTRLSIVDEAGHTILDRLVKPHAAIVDYKTQFGAHVGRARV